MVQLDIQLGVGVPTYYSHSVFENSYVKVRELVCDIIFPNMSRHDLIVEIYR